MGKIEGRRRRGQQRTRRLDGITDLIDMSWSELGDSEGQVSRFCSPWGHKETDTTERLILSLSGHLQEACNVVLGSWV